MRNKNAAIKQADALAIARAVMSQWIELSTSGAVPFYWCLFCDATLKDEPTSPLRFEHDPDCPVRIADKIVRRFDPVPDLKRLPALGTI